MKVNQDSLPLLRPPSLPTDTKDHDGNLIEINYDKIAAEVHPTSENTIYLNHYSVGEPVMDLRDVTKFHTEIKLATAAKYGQELLGKFTTHVLS